MRQTRSRRQRSPAREARGVLRSLAQRYPNEVQSIARVLAALSEQETQLKDMQRKVEQHVGLDLFDKAV